MSLAFPETRACSKATRFAVPSFSALMQAGNFDNSSFTAAFCALRAVAESFRQAVQQCFPLENDFSFQRCFRNDILIVWKLSLAAASDQARTIRQHEQIKFLLGTAG